MKTLEEIQARLKAIQDDIQQRGAAVTEDEMKAYTDEVEQLKAARKALVESAEQRKKLLEDIAAGVEGEHDDSMNGFNSKARKSDIFATVEYRQAFMDYVCRGKNIPAQYRADSYNTTADTSVGAIIPTTVLNTIVEKLETTGKILALVNRTAYKGGVAIPTSAVKPTASFVAERASSDKQAKTVAKSGMITFAYHKLRCAVAVSLEVNTMALSVFETTVINNITEAMAKALEQAIISGSGSGQPKGILAETPVTGQAIESVSPAYDDLINAEAALPEAYEAEAVWLMSKKTFMAYVGLKDDNGQPIARTDHGINGAPERFLLGRPVVCNEYVTSYASTLTAGTVFAALFRMKDYTLNTNLAMGIKKYEDNDTDDVVTKAVMLVDGKVVDKNSLVIIKKKAAAASSGT